MSREQEEPRPARSDIDAHARAMELPIRDLVVELVDLLGATTVAVIGGVSETRAVAQWMASREPQRPHVLRFALQLALMISSRADRQIAQAWFHGTNPRLGDRSPMMLLRSDRLDESQAALLDAARSFAGRTTP
jgi:hypothetical protein